MKEGKMQRREIPLFISVLFLFCSYVWGDPINIESIQYMKKGNTGVFKVLVILPKHRWIRVYSEDPKIYLIYTYLGNAPVASSSEKRKGYLWIYGRFRGKGKAKVLLLSGEEKIGEIKLNLPEEEGGDITLLREWASLRNNSLLKYLKSNVDIGFYAYLIQQSARKYGAEDVVDYYGIITEEQVPASVGLYAIISGGAAVQESLQLEIMREGPWDRGEKSIPISQLKSPDIKSHPFGEMLKGRTYRISSLANIIPYDQYYLYLTNLSRAEKIIRIMGLWGSSILKTYRVNARNYKLEERYMEELGLGGSPELSKLIAGQILSEAAITGNDLLLRDGADLTLILKPRERNALEIFENMSLALLKREGGLKREKINYREKEIERIYTPDGRINSYRVWLGDYRIYSNLLEGIKRIIDVYEGNLNSLAKSGDFQYMRSVFPQDENKEDVFIYLSEAFIRKIISPQYRIANRRRIICKTHLQMISYAYLMAKIDEGKEMNLPELVKEGYIEKEYLVCPDGGEYQIKEGVPQCSIHGSIRYPEPILGINIDQITAREAEEYREFKENYSRYWRTYFDPIGITLSLKNNKLTVQTYIFPLIENSIYNTIKDISGGSPVVFKEDTRTENTLFSLYSKLNKEAVKEFLWERGTGMLGEETVRERIMRSLTEEEKKLDFLGDYFILSFHDYEPLFSLDFSSLQRINTAFFSPFTLMATQFFNLPFSFVIDLKDPVKAKEFLNLIIHHLTRLPESYSVDLKVNFYRIKKDRGWYTATLDILSLIKLRFFFTIQKNRLIFTNKEWILRDIIQKLEETSSSPVFSGNIALRYYPEAYKRTQEYIEQGWREKITIACIRNLPLLDPLFWSFGDIPSIPEATLNYYGYQINCPEKGEYRFDPVKGHAYCTVHGDIWETKSPPGIDKDLSVYRFLMQQQSAKIILEFTKEGIMTTLTLDVDKIK